MTPVRVNNRTVTAAEYRALSAKAMSEADLQSAVIDLAHALGWRVAHFRPGLTQSGNWRTPVAADGVGFPDLVLVRDRVIFAELKSAKGVVSNAQFDWLRALQGVAEVHLWRPEHWADGTVERVLTRKAVVA